MEIEVKSLRQKASKQRKQKVRDFFKGLDFSPSTHTYKHGYNKLKSASSVIKKFVEPFDAEKIAGYVARARSKKEGRFVSKNEILAEWEEKKNFACDKGNRVHDFGESYAHNLLGTHSVDHIPTDGYERAVLAFWDSIPDHIEPFMMELQMYSLELGIAGTADIILYNTKTGNFIIADYKTNIDLFKNHKGKTLLPPFDDMLDMPLSKYQIQLSIYQHLFEQSGFKVEQRKIVWLKEDGTFRIFKTDDLRDKVLKAIK